MPIFRSSFQGELLAATLLDPDTEQSLTELAHRLRASVATVQREVSRLEKAGLLCTRRIGNTRLVRADKSSPSFEPLSALVLQSFGPQQVIAEEFAGLRGTKEVVIFGSWAARHDGVPGQAPVDIDVLVIGSAGQENIYHAARRAEERLKRPVNATIRSRARWEHGTDGFVQHVRSEPKLVVWKKTRRNKTQ